MAETGNGRRAHFKHHSHRLKANPEWVHKYVHVGDIFKRPGYPEQLYSYKVARITKQGRVVFERKLGAGPKSRKTLCIKFKYGIPVAESSKVYPISLDGQLWLDNQKKYIEAVDQEAHTVVGKRFLDPFDRQIHVPKSWDPMSRFLSTAPYIYRATLGFVGPDKPLQVMQNEWALESVKKMTGSEYVPVTMKRDYSAEVEIVLCCYAWNLPREIALYIVDLFGIANYHYYDSM